MSFKKEKKNINSYDEEYLSVVKYELDIKKNSLKYCLNATLTKSTFENRKYIASYPLSCMWLSDIYKPVSYLDDNDKIVTYIFVESEFKRNIDKNKEKKIIELLKKSHNKFIIKKIKKLEGSLI